MPVANFSNTTPAPPSGSQNILWQQDGSGNVSAYPQSGSWAIWTPTLSADAGNFTLSSLYLNQYWQSGPTVFFELRFAATTDNASAAFLSVTLPTSVVAPNNFAATPAAIVENCPAGITTWSLATTRVQVPNTVVMQLPALSRWPVGSYLFAVSGFYRTA